MNWTEIRQIHPGLPENSEGWHQHPSGGWVHNTARVSASAYIAEAALVGRGVWLGVGVRLGRGVWLDDGVWLGRGVRLGNGVRLGVGVRLDRSPIYIRGSRFWIGWTGNDLVSSGCITKPLAWWLENVERCAEEHDYTPDEQAEYREHVEHIARWMRRYGYLKETPQETP